MGLGSQLVLVLVLVRIGRKLMELKKLHWGLGIGVIVGVGIGVRIGRKLMELKKLQLS